MTLSAFFAVALIQLVAAMSPGPSFVVSVRTAAQEGFVTAAFLALGFGLGAALWAGAALAGLALLFELVPQLFLALKLAGGAFLLYIAFRMWRHAPEPLPDRVEGTAPTSPGTAIRLGFVTFVANPKPAVFFGAVFVGLVPPGTALGWKLALITVIFANETIWYLVVARVFSLPGPRALYARAKSLIDRAFGTMMALLGLKIALG